MKVKKTNNSLSLNGKISENYQIPPGVRITLEAGVTFKGVDVGEQIVYNDDCVVNTFTLDTSEELQLISCELVQEEFFTTCPTATTLRPSDATTLSKHPLTKLILINTDKGDPLDKSSKNSTSSGTPEPLSPDIPTLHTTLTPPPTEVQKTLQTWAESRSLHTPFLTTPKEQEAESPVYSKIVPMNSFESAVQQLEIFNKTPNTIKDATDSTLLVGEGMQPAVESHGCGCIIL